MFKPNEALRPGRIAAMTGVALLAVAALTLSLTLDVSAGVASSGTIGPTDEAPSTAVPRAPAPAPQARAGAYRLRCWQYGRLLFDEGPIRLAAEAQQGARLIGTDRNGAALLVTEAGGATCLMRATAAPPNLALPR